MNTKISFKTKTLFIIITILMSFSLQGCSLLKALPGASTVTMRGGTHLELYPDTSDNSVATADQLNAAKQVIRRRLDSQNLFNATINIDSANNKIIVEIPKSNQNINADSYVKLITATSELTFRDVTGLVPDSATGEYPPTGEVILKGTNIVSAKAMLSQNSKTWDVSLKFDSAGTKSFSEWTAKLIGKPIAIFMDEDMISAPNVQSAITNGEAVITTNSEDPTEANTLAAQISSGSLPFKLVAKKVYNIP